MADDIVVRITGVDKLTPVLIKIGDAAEKAAADMKKAGADGKKAMSDIESGAKKTDQAMRTFERTSLAVGAALGATAFAVIRVSDAYRQQERQIAAINRLYGDASEGLLDYAETIQMTTRFSNDAARESAVLLNTLTQNYGYSTDQIETLISRSADLAQLHGRSLTEITQMVSNALRGEGEYIEQIGVSMNQTFVAAEAAARGIANFTTDLTQAEQAAFRYTLLLEQTAAAQGYAAETMEGARGGVGLLINEFGDAAQAVGGMLGPVSELAAEFSEYALWMPLIASQTARVSAILVNAARSGQLFASAMSLVTAVTSPWALAITGLVTLGGILGMKWLENSQDAAQLAEAMKEAERAASELRVAIRDLSLIDLFGGRWAQDASIQISNIFANFREITAEEIEDLTMNRGDFANAFNAWLDEEWGLIEATERQRESFATTFFESLVPTPQQEAALSSAMTKFTNLLGVAGEFSRSALQANWDRLFDQFVTGQITVDEFTASILYMAEANAQAIDSLEGVNLAQHQLEAAQATALAVGSAEMASEAYDQYQQTIQEASEALDGLTDAEKKHADTFRALWEGTEVPQEFTDWLEEQNERIEERTRLTKEAFEAERALREEMQEMARDDAGGDATLEHLRTVAEEAAEVRKEILDTYAAAFGFDTPLAQINLGGLANQFTQLAGSIQGAAGQLDTVFRVIVGNTDALAQQAQGVLDWADTLIGAAGTYAVIDDLLNQGIITWNEYSAAQQAYNDIAQDTASIQSYVNEIQAMQAPFIAQHLGMMENELELLAQQDTAQQRITLGWMDSATAAQAYTLITQAAAVANGELGSSGREAFHEMIEGAIAVNPFLFDMLETIGLVNGTPLDFEVNFDGVTDGISEIERLTIRIEDLVRALGGSLTDIPIDVSVTGMEDIEAAEAAAQGLLKLKGESIGMSLEVTDNLSTIGGIGSGIGKILSGGTIDPVVIPASLQFGDGTGGGTGDNSLAGAIPDEPIKIPAEIDLATDRIDEYFSQEQRTIQVAIETDSGQVEQALGALGQDQIEGPTFVFQADPESMLSTIEVYSGANIDGPMFTFQTDASLVQATTSLWANHVANGPRFDFNPDSGRVSAAVGVWRSASFDGPTFHFQADTSAVAAAVGAYAGRTVGTVYINVQPRMSAALPFQHGGIPGFAQGGIPAVLAENNRPEVLHFANGGSTVVRNEGLYMVPPHSLVSPSNNDRSPGRGGDMYFNINIEGSVVGKRELLGEFASAIADEVERHERAAGLAR